ncbi:MAG: hypothetical protein WAN16_02570 [Chthoniobacterales bacterium]
MTPRCFVLSFFLLIALLACSPKTHAGASNKNGNPFGNGTFFQTTGTFSAVVRGPNLSGTTVFSTGVNTNSTNSSSSGTTTISYLGSDGARAGIYIGNASGFWNPSSGSINGQLWGGLRLSGSNSTTIWPQIYNTNIFPVPINTLSNTVTTVTEVDIFGVTNSYVTNIVTTNTIYVMPYGSNSLNDTAYMSGNFSGNTANSYPNQTFTAQGALVQQQLAPQVVDTAEGTVPVQMAPDLQIPITVQGMRVSDNYSSFNTVSNSVPYSWTTYSITNFAGFGQVQ